MIGLKRGEVALCEHCPEWKNIAQETINNLKEIFGSNALNIQHIGSTAISSIKAKPIIDIAVGIRNFDDINESLFILDSNKIYKQSHNRFSGDLLYVINDQDGKRTHQIHILIYESPQWWNYVAFRDYMNAFPQKAKEYEKLKVKLARKYPNSQTKYTDAKQQYMKDLLVEAISYARCNKVCPLD